MKNDIKSIFDKKINYSQLVLCTSLLFLLFICGYLLGGGYIALIFPVLWLLCLIIFFKNNKERFKLVKTVKSILKGIVLAVLVLLLIEVTDVAVLRIVEIWS
ncbi:putative membrane protein YfhO [Methanomicrobium sp. W14]|uniref:hypothetical protein n=1 Tax=Methanomicrobium sp. W14 TaxID=2817839 RepID=UPI001AE0F84F|nr:hypothetical protein [Methanomicrobium sp. W14]MBP2133565.1 putative membrane protein YfhO [Methanomicrobium sp. W14]